MICTCKYLQVHVPPHADPRPQHVFAEQHEQTAAERSRFGQFCKKHRRPLCLAVRFCHGKSRDDVGILGVAPYGKRTTPIYMGVFGRWI